MATFLTGTVFPYSPIFGFQPDILLVIMLSVILIEQSAVVIIMTAIAAIGMDIIFVGSLGFYSFPYVFVGLVAYFIFVNREYNKVLIPPIVAAAAWLVKDSISGIISVMKGNKVDVFETLIGSTFPGIVINAILMFFVYLALRWLYSFAFMRPRISLRKDDFMGGRNKPRRKGV